MNSYRFRTTALWFTGLALIFGVRLASGAPDSDVPRLISYQGLLRNSEGRPIEDANHVLTVSLYLDENGGNALWSDSYSTLTERGIFNLVLGSGSKMLPFPTLLSRSLWVGVRVDGGEEMRPLSRLLSVPYALTVPDNTISTEKIQNYSVTEDKIGANFVQGIKINGVSVTGRGSVLNLVNGGNTSLTFDSATNSLAINALNTAAHEGDGGERTQAVTDRFVPYYDATTNPPGYENSSIKESGTSLSVVDATTIPPTVVLTIQESSGNLNTSGTLHTSGHFNTDGHVNTTNSEAFMIDGHTVLNHGYSRNNLVLGNHAANGVDLENTTANVFQDNVFVGDYVGQSATGNQNTAVGTYAFAAPEGGSNNSALGFISLENTTTGSDNTAVGAGALYSNVTGSSNTAIGTWADVAQNATNLTNATVIGYGAVVNASNKIQLGNADVTSLVTAGAITTGMPTAAPNQPGAIVFNDGMSSHHSGAGWKTAFSVSTGQTEDISYVLPSSPGTVGQSLTVSTTNGGLAWESWLSHLITDGTLLGNGAAYSSPLRLNLCYPNLWTNTQTFQHVCDVGDAPAVVVLKGINQSSNDILQVRDGLTTPYFHVDYAGHTYIDQPAGVIMSTSDGRLYAGSLTLSDPVMTGTLEVTRGGTGATAFTSNGVLYGNGTDPILATDASTADGQFLQTTLSGEAPTWKSVLGVANGGTGSTTLADADITIGHGTAGTIPRWKTAHELENSAMTDDGVTVQIGGTQFVITEATGDLNTTGTLSIVPTTNNVVTAQLTGAGGTSNPDIVNVNTSGPGGTTMFSVNAAGAVVLGNNASTSTPGVLKLNDGTGHATTITTSQQSADINYALPAAQGATGYYLTLLNTNGEMAWVSGTPAAPVNAGPTLKGFGTQAFPLDVDLDHHNTWTNTISIHPATDVAGMEIFQTSGIGPNVPSTNVFVVKNNSGIENYAAVDKHGDVTVNRDLRLGYPGLLPHPPEVAGVPQGKTHIVSNGQICQVFKNVSTNANVDICFANDVAGLVSFQACTNCVPAAGRQLDIHLQKPYALVPGLNGTPPPAIVVSGYDAKSAALIPFGEYNVNANGVGIITICTVYAPNPGNPANDPDGQQGLFFRYYYHVIDLQQSTER